MSKRSCLSTYCVVKVCKGLHGEWKGKAKPIPQLPQNQVTRISSDFFVFVDGLVWPVVVWRVESKKFLILNLKTPHSSLVSVGADDESDTYKDDEGKEYCVEVESVQTHCHSEGNGNDGLDVGVDAC